jgi:zinc transport system ATP-binding protein
MTGQVEVAAGGAVQGARPVVVLKGVYFSYDGTNVLEDANLTVAQRDFACIVGPNGGGKTTLLRVILGLLKPQEGTVEVLGTTPEAARPRIGYMPQYLLFDPSFPVTVRDVVLMGCLGHGPAVGPSYGRSCKAAAMEALGEVAMTDYANRLYSALSGGQRQRTLIARALASRPEMLMLDEPTSNLDVQGERELYELLSRLNERLTIVTVTHDLAFVSKYVRTVVCVKQRVVVHPTTALTGADFEDIYGEGVCAVRHDIHSGEDHAGV